MTTGNRTYRYPEDLRIPGQARERIPHPRRETTGRDGADTQQIEAMIHVMHRVRMARHQMVRRRKRKANRAAQEEKGEYYPIIRVRGRIVGFGHGAEVDRHCEHPGCG